MTEAVSTKITNIVLAGVGGQGILLASKLLSEAALLEGYDVKANEVHGMAQRGGSVIAQIRFGDKIYSPLVKTRTARFLIALEVIEAVRHARYLAPDGIAYINTQRIIPTTVSSGQANYPPNPEELIQKTISNYKTADCLQLARQVGSARCVNVVMAGWISKDLPFSEDTWKQTMKHNIKEQFIEMNQKAFELGKKLNE